MKEPPLFPTALSIVNVCEQKIQIEENVTQIGLALDFSLTQMV